MQKRIASTSPLVLYHRASAIITIMATIKFTIHGVEVTATNAADAAALIRELASTKTEPQRTQAVPPKRIERRPPISRLRLQNRAGFDVALAAFRFLAMVKTAGTKG